MEKNKKVNTYSTKFKTYLNNTVPTKKTLTYGEGENAFEVVVNPVLRFEDIVKMVNEIVDLVFVSGETYAAYTPAYEDFAKRYVAISYYTDFKLPKKLDDAWLILKYTSLYDDVIEIVGKDIVGIYAAADNAIASKCRYLENKTDLNAFMDKATSESSQGYQFTGEDVKQLLGTLKGLNGISIDNIVDVILKAKDKQGTMTTNKKI